VVKKRGSASRWFIAIALAGVLLVWGGGLRVIGHAVGVGSEPSGQSAPGNHVDPFSSVLLEFAFLLIFAMIGRFVASRFNQASVLGELLIGVVVGNFGYQLGLPFAKLIMNIGSVGQLFRRIWDSGLSLSHAAREVCSLEALQRAGADPVVVGLLTGPDSVRLLLLGAALFLFSQLGVVLLLFMAGIDSTVADLLRVGERALWVALAGIVLPMTLGFLAARFFLAEETAATHLFVGATLCATSVGITARVLKDLGRMQTPETRTILGAAVIDDVFGLVILAVVAGIATTGQVHVGEISKMLLYAVLFLGVTIMFGRRIARFFARTIGGLDHHEGKLLFPIVFALICAWLANQIGLAMIVGAFAAGLMLEDGDFEGQENKRHLDKLLTPIEAVFAPVFFVLMGAQVNLETFANPSILSLALVLTVVAIAGKLVTGWFAGKGTDRWTVGIGMVPRGEVGLIFASVGKGLGAIPDYVFSAIVVVVILTTFVTPPGLRWSQRRWERRVEHSR
tara:strand:- start:50875 stop:52398 length:1524 start_codon:yes stop_codon:yes gene_type:complete